MEILKHNSLKKIITTIKNGGLIIFPTDTVWGLGCNALDNLAVQRLINLKQKPADAKLIWLLPSIKAVKKYCGQITPEISKLLNQKRTTVIINDQAVRIIKNGWLHKILNCCHTPLIATSANIHQQPTITSWHQAIKVFNDKVDVIIRGRRITKNIPSTVVSITDGQIKILRQGGGISIK